MKYLFICLFVFVPFFGLTQDIYWRMEPDGSIRNNLTHQRSYSDHIEMSGRFLSAIIRYGKDSLGHLRWSRQLVFPMLRTIPNDTRGSLTEIIDTDIFDSITIAGARQTQEPLAFQINGFLAVESRTGNISIRRTAFPSTDKCAFIERYLLRNNGNHAVEITIPEINKNITTPADKGVYGSYVINTRTEGHTDIRLQPGESYTFSIIISGRKANEQPYYFSPLYEWEKRMQFVKSLQQDLVLETPNDTINRMFTFAKIRAAESIFDTKEGLMHAPGGGDYYAAIWANDQAEYVNPFFPFLHNAAATESARNGFRIFAKYINDDYRPIPSSIIAEADSFWNGAGDRGDQAMIAYGASLFALYQADTAAAKQLWKLISWCNEFLRRKKTSQGVITSDSDELEGRFEAGNINLSTNVLAYAAFLHASKLAACLGLQEEKEKLERDAAALRTSIEKYFGADVEGFDTYRYFDGNKKLRSWICLPLVMGIFNRKDETIKALLSKNLWTRNGILTESNSTAYWDRSTLYAFRGIFKAGATDTAMEYFRYYSAMRLLGAHVPYAIEAWPEGDQRHLAAESGLYCRAITEGLFAIEPQSFSSFTIRPRLPKGWKRMALRHVRIFNRDFDIDVQRTKAGYQVTILSGGKELQYYRWDGEKELAITLQ